MVVQTVTLALTLRMHNCPSFFFPQSLMVLIILSGMPISMSLDARSGRASPLVQGPLLQVQIHFSHTAN